MAGKLEREGGYKGEEGKDKTDPVRMGRSRNQWPHSSKAGALCHEICRQDLVDNEGKPRQSEPTSLATALLGAMLVLQISGGGLS